MTLGAYLMINGILGPVVEELYFRGYLLPRMEHLGRWAPLINVTLFSLYHFWSPWQLVARILALAPMAYAVRWKQNVYLGMVVHCALNSLGILLVVRLVLGRLSRCRATDAGRVPSAEAEPPDLPRGTITPPRPSPP